MFAISPLTLILFTVCIFPAALVRRCGARFGGVAAAVVAVASVVGFVLVFLAWKYGGTLNDKWIALAVFGLYLALFLAFFAVVSSDRIAPARAAAASCGIWLFMLILFLRIFPRDYAENLWFLDISNKLLLTVVPSVAADAPASPLLAAYGAVNLSVARYFLVFASSSVCLLGYFFHVGFAGYFRRESVISFRRLAAPRFLPAAAVALYVVVALFHRFGDLSQEANMPDLMLGAVGGVYFILGASWFFAVLKSSSALKYPAWLLLAAAFPARCSVLLFIFAGFIGNCFQLQPDFSDASPRWGPRLAQILEQWISWKGILLTIVAAILLGASGDSALDSPQPVGACPTTQDGVHSDMRRICEANKTFLMDVYEYPNRAGAVPTTGLSYDDAASACVAAGKRLCRADEWSSACSGFAGKSYEFAEEQADSRRILNEKCNVLPLGLRRDGVMPSGAMPCVNDLGLRDMTGNVWEWTEGKKGVLRIAKGGSHQYNDDQTTQCGFEMLLTEAQIAELKLSAVGFRCCQDDGRN